MEIKNYISIQELFCPTPSYEGEFTFRIEILEQCCQKEKNKHNIQTYFEKSYMQNIKNALKEFSFVEPCLPLVSKKENGSRVLKISGLTFINDILRGRTGKEILERENITIDEIVEEARRILKEYKSKLSDVKHKGKDSIYYQQIFARYETEKELYEMQLRNSVAVTKDRKNPNLLQDPTEAIKKYMLACQKSGKMRRYDIEVFIGRELQGITNLLINIKYILEVLSKSIDLNIIEENIDLEIFYLYISSIIIEIIKTDEEKTNQLNSLFSFIETYVFAILEIRKKNKYNLELTHHDFKKNKKTSYSVNQLLKDYADIRFRHPEFNSANDINKAISLTASWEFIRKGTRNEPREQNESQTQIVIKKPDKAQELEAIKLKIIKRKKFLDETPYIYHIIGKNNFEGFIGYIYADGTVRFEKFYEDLERQIPATDNATYKMTIENFEEMSQKTKTEIMDYIKDGATDVKRFYHTSTWQQRMEKDIENGTYDEETIERIDALLSIRNLLKEQKTGKVKKLEV